MIDAMFADKSVKVHACEKSLEYFKEAEATLATEDDWHAEYLDLEIAVRIVDDFDQAVAHIQEYGSGHTEVIVTEHLGNSQRFINSDTKSSS